jgi:hypothetical protein
MRHSNGLILQEEAHVYPGPHAAPGALGDARMSASRVRCIPVSCRLGRGRPSPKRAAVMSKAHLLSTVQRASSEPTALSTRLGIGLVSWQVMAALKATVRDGRLVLDLPTDLPNGAEVSLVPVEGWDDLDEEDRRRLYEALLASEDDIAHGRVFTAEEVLAGLRGA